MYSIGEFSKITLFSIKTIRYYDEIGLLTPSSIDEESGYRYYDKDKIGIARKIAYLKSISFSLKEIKNILETNPDEEAFDKILSLKKNELNNKISELKKALSLIDQEITFNLEDKNMNDIIVKTIDDIYVISKRETTSYDKIGNILGKLYKATFKNKLKIIGYTMALYYEPDYKELADLEVAIPIKLSESQSNIEKIEDMTIKKLIGGKFISIMHKGPYSELGKSYQRLIDYIKENKYETDFPSREVYIKGPSLFRNPKNYFTELLIKIL